MLGNVNNARQIGPPEKDKPGQLRRQETNPEDEIVLLSSDDENDPDKAPAAHRLPKATQLVRLTRSIPDATNNVALSKLLRDFIEVLQSNRSRTLTKEGFGFLDALHKHLADPNAFVLPIRTSRSKGSHNEESRELDPRRAKANKLYTLRRGVNYANNNEALGKLVVDFGGVIDKSNGRTLTKDAFGFLEDVTAKLRELR